MPVRISKNRVALENIPLNEAATVIVASATSTAIGAAASNNVDISGTTTITSFDTVAEGINRKGRFTGALTLTHNATSLILPGAANITTAANDRYEARSLGSGNWIVTKYQKADGTAVVGGAAASQAEVDAATITTVYLSPERKRITLANEQATTSGTAIDFTGIPAGTRRITIMFVGVSTNGTSNYLVQLGDAGGIENTGYSGAGSIVTTTGGSTDFTTGFGIRNQNGAASVINGTVVLSRENANTWTCHGVLSGSDGPYSMLTSGSKATSDELDRVRITSVTPDTFDLGKINISYER